MEYHLGEALKFKEWARFMPFLTCSKAKICVLYGASECHGVIGCYVNPFDNTAIPIGYPFPSVQCLLIDEQGQMISNANNERQIGEIHIGCK